MLETMLMAAAGGVLLAVGGYLVGARIGSTARERLRQIIRNREEELRRLRLELSGVLKAEKSGLIQSSNLPVTAPLDDALQDRLQEIERRDAERTEALMSQLQRLQGSLQGGDSREEDLAAQVRGVVGPLADRARMQAALTDLPDDYRHRGHLSQLLATVADRAALSTVILSDEAGLPLAEASAEASEALAAAASLLLTLTDRLDSSGQPAAVGAVVRDTEGRLVLHRIFLAGGERYVLTGVSKGTSLSPEALDPVLPQIRQLLVQPGPIVEAVA